MKKFKKIGVLGVFLALFIPGIAPAWFGHEHQPPSLRYLYSPYQSCHGLYYGRWYSGYRVGFDSCDILVQTGVIVRVYRYFPA